MTRQRISIDVKPNYAKIADMLDIFARHAVECAKELRDRSLEEEENEPDTNGPNWGVQ